MRVQGPSGDSNETPRGTAAGRAKCPGRSRPLHAYGCPEDRLVRPVRLAEGHPPVPLVVVMRHGGEIRAVRTSFLAPLRTGGGGGGVFRVVLVGSDGFWALVVDFWALEGRAGWLNWKFLVRF
jgi:hypothetical protein